MHRRFGDFIQDIKTFGQMPKNDIILSQRISGMHDEELRAIGIGSGIGHGDRAARIIAGKRFIVKLIARAAGAVTFRIAALDHEILDDAMENGAVIKIFLCQPDKIIHGDRRGIVIQKNFHIAGGSV